MPELPEVEHLRLSLIPRLVGRTIQAVRVHRRDVVAAPGDPGSGLARSRSPKRPRGIAPEDLLVAAQIAELRRAGKQLAIISTEGRAICVHLGMSGQLRWLPPDAPRRRAPHEHITWRLEDESRLAFRDPRRFGGVWVFRSVAELEAARWSALGHDALSITPAQLEPKLRRASRAIKAALLDQSLIAGVGNIYADEALFAAGLAPTRSAASLNRREVARLTGAIRRIMLASIASGGSTLRNYIDGDGKRGNNQAAFAVYGRAGQPCPSCSRPLILLRIAQRATVMCPECQR